MNNKNITRGMFVFSLVIFGCYILGLLLPDKWWGTHFIAFLPAPVTYTLITISAVLILLGGLWWKPVSTPEIISRGVSKALKSNWTILIIGLVMAALFYQFPIYLDYYGDAFVVLDDLGNKVEEIPAYVIDELTSFNFRPEHGRIFMLGIFNLISWGTGLNFQTVFVIVGIVSGFLWVMLWLYYVKRYIQEPLWQLIMGFLGITAPCMQIFFGHNEVYAPIYIVVLVLLIALNQFINTQKKSYLWLSVILLLVAVRVHPLSLLLIPSVLLVCLSTLKGRLKFIERFLTWKNIYNWLIIPIFIAGAIFYFFIQEDYKDPRVLKSTSAQDRLFLPLINPPEPYNRYNMLGFNHVFDYFNIILFWSTPLLLLLLTITTYFKSKISWNRLGIIVFGLPIIFYGSFLFVFNPLLSMPMDWDLFSLMVPLLLMFALVLVKQLEGKGLPGKRLLAYFMAFTLLNLPFFYINSAREPYANRLVSVGIHVFRTYYEWSGKQLDFAFYLLKEDKEKFRAAQERVLHTLRPYAIEGNDEHYGHLLSIYGTGFADEGRHEKAFHILEDASEFAPVHKINLLRLLQSAFITRRYDDAVGIALRLLDLEYPDNKKAMRIAIHCMLEAEMYRDAYRYAEMYNDKWPGEETIEQVEFDIDNQKNPEQLKFLFARPN